MAKKKAYDAKELFLQGLMAFGSIFGRTGGGPRSYSVNEARKRRDSHAKFKAQCAARREQRLCSTR